jgi:hypothetical protein
MGPLRNSAANEGGEAPNPAVTLPVDPPRGLTFEGGGGAPNREVELPVNPPRSPAAEGGTNLSRKDVRKKRKAERKMRGDLQKALKRPVWAVPREVDTGFHAAMGISVELLCVPVKACRSWFS